MAVLNEPHWEAISPIIRQVLASTGKLAFAPRFYLAGGSGLALQIGHRKSVDLDFFSETDEVGEATQQEIIHQSESLSPKVLERSQGNLVLLIWDVRLGFFSYGYRLLESVHTVENIQIASILDIGLMKLDALATRGSRRDFYDLYFITRQIPLEGLLERGQEKYPYARDFPMLVLENLVSFDNADRDRQPLLLVDVPWWEVRQYFLDQARALGRKWFDLPG